MTQSRQPNDRDIFIRVAQLEYRLSKIENTQELLEDTIAPGGYVTDAFERVVERIDERIDEVRSENKVRYDELNGKIDLILRHLTGMGGGNP
jgi:hypothetical protein